MPILPLVHVCCPFSYLRFFKYDGVYPLIDLCYSEYRQVQELRVKLNFIIPRVTSSGNFYLASFRTNILRDLNLFILRFTKIK